MVIECTDKTDESEVISFLQGMGAQNVKAEYKETGWWIGRYDKQQKLYESKVEAVV